mmetsp:Transcript_133295/g.315992  ORF Transcript_133295/g.315992 Transcript_133295/m.315992 type:complete len:261 (+) Transcript_133295:1945-2727(+)
MMRRSLRCTPAPQLLLHVCHSSHMLILQSTSSVGSPQGPVSSDGPTQGRPPFTATCRMLRSRDFWPLFPRQLLESHSIHWVKEQSCGSSHSLGQCLVLTSGPSQAAPPHLFILEITRWRSQSCVQLGPLHSDHSPKMQFSGSHEWQLLNGHSITSTCEAAQVTLRSPEKKVPDILRQHFQPIAPSEFVIIPSAWVSPYMLGIRSMGMLNMFGSRSTSASTRRSQKFLASPYCTPRTPWASFTSVPKSMVHLASVKMFLTR